jgi:hypothetical protein
VRRAKGGLQADRKVGGSASHGTVTTGRS